MDGPASLSAYDAAHPFTWQARKAQVDSFSFAGGALRRSPRGVPATPAPAWAPPVSAPTVPASLAPYASGAVSAQSTRQGRRRAAAAFQGALPPFPTPGRQPPSQDPSGPGPAEVSSRGSPGARALGVAKWTPARTRPTRRCMGTRVPDPGLLHALWTQSPRTPEVWRSRLQVQSPQMELGAAPPTPRPRHRDYTMQGSSLVAA